MANINWRGGLSAAGAAIEQVGMAGYAIDQDSDQPRETLKYPCSNRESEN